MRIKPILLAGALLLVPSLSSFGAFNAIVNSNGGPQYIDTDNSLLSGSIIRAGVFTADPTAAIATAINNGGFDALNAIFTGFGENSGTTDDGTLPGGVDILTINDAQSAGHVFHTISNIEQGYAGGPGAAVSVWVINSDSLETATAFGVFQAANWTVPALGAVVLSTSNLDDPSEFLAGSRTDNGIQLQRIIPEPSVAAFLGLGSLLVLRRRK